MHNRPMLGLVHELRLETRPLLTPRLRRMRDPDAAPPEVAAKALPWRERRATAAAQRRSAR